MTITNISKEDKKATIELSSSELVDICNALHASSSTNKNEQYHTLYSELMIARDICQYGHIDDFCLEQIIKERNITTALKTAANNALSDKNIATFNTYLEDNDIPTACGNSDWNEVYTKIVGDKISPKLRQWKNRAYEQAEE